MFRLSAIMMILVGLDQLWLLPLVLLAVDWLAKKLNFISPFAKRIWKSMSSFNSKSICSRVGICGNYYPNQMQEQLWSRCILIQLTLVFCRTTKAPRLVLLLRLLGVNKCLAAGANSPMNSGETFS